MKRSFSDSGQSVLIAMSGGVDSTAAALKLLESGYTLIGCTFVTRYTLPASIEAAQALAAQLGIEHHVVDYSEMFESTIVDYFISEYEAGRTPNPCVLCNRLIKFGALVKEADRLGCDFIATGHYARLSNSSFIRVAADVAKDQSYFLWQVEPTVLERVLFPLGDMTKTEVREYLAQKGFESLSKQGESQDICFIPNDYRTFLRERLRDKYKEYMSFTIGQRKGLGVALGYPAFVTCIGGKEDRCKEDRNKEEMSKGVGVEHPNVPGVYLGHHDDLYAMEVQLRDVIFRGDPNQPVMAKIRYRSPATEAILQRSDPSAQRSFSEAVFQQSGRLSFTQPVWAPTPGQSCVFYQSNLVVGGGVIV